jgi:hypothetical protein
MAEHGDVRIFDGADDALCHLGLGEVEDVVNARHGVVELGQNLVGEVERAVFEDVHLATGKEMRAFELGIQLADLGDLRQQTLFIEAVGLEGRFAVIGDAEVLQAEVVGCLRHLAKGGAAIAGGGVVVKGAAQVFQLDEPRKAAMLGGVDLAGVFAKLRLDEVEAEGAVKITLVVNLWCFRAFLHEGEAVLVQRQALLERPATDGHVVLLAAGEIS